MYVGNASFSLHILEHIVNCTSSHARILIISLIREVTWVLIYFPGCCDLKMLLHFLDWFCTWFVIEVTCYYDILKKLHFVYHLANLSFSQTSEFFPCFQVCSHYVDDLPSLNLLVLALYKESTYVTKVVRKWMLLEVKTLVLLRIVVYGTAHDSVCSHLSLATIAITFVNDAWLGCHSLLSRVFKGLIWWNIYSTVIVTTECIVAFLIKLIAVRIYKSA